MAAATAPRVNPFRRIARFWVETVEELRKASWPDWTELRDSTLLVLVSVALLGLFISVSDFSVFQLIHLLSRWATAGF